MANVLRGECECRATQYEVRDEFVYAANCHCSRCRAGTGTAFKAVRRDRAGEAHGHPRRRQPARLGRRDGNHTRCGTCGSLLFSVVRDGEYVHVAMGSLQDEPTIRPTGHIFVGSKAPWFEITDDLPQADEY